MSPHIFLGREIPPRSIVGLLGDENAGISEQLSTAGVVGVRIVNYALDRHHPSARLRAKHDLVEARRAGATILLASWDERLMRDICDEVWLVSGSEVLAQGDPGEMLDAWRAQIAIRWLEEQTGTSVALAPDSREGDGRAAIRGVDLLNSNGQPVLAWSSGEDALIRVDVEFLQPVDDPVIGVLIRTAIGLNVYGTNTELEQLNLGPRAAGDRLRVEYRFRCELCPGDYTVTVASHDPDGTKHEWLESAVAFSIGDTRYTAGIANLRAEVSWELLSNPL